ADGSRSWLWTIRHEELHVVDGIVVPEKTSIEQPKANGRGTTTINVTYLKQTLNPSLGGTLSADPPKDDGPANAGDQWDGGDDWSDDGEDDDGGWEEADGSGPAEDDTGGEPDPEPEQPAKPTMPPQFVGNPSGLTPRGDLCKR
ncbi:MAG: hypothetical protein KC431_03385, partial [Myxococcales bacterium]|nr:hypothetical protein [Myxococcales bacterium]